MGTGSKGLELIQLTQSAPYTQPVNSAYDCSTIYMANIGRRPVFNERVMGG